MSDCGCSKDPCGDLPEYPTETDAQKACDQSGTAKCTFWTGDPVTELGITTNMSLEEVVLKIKDAIVLLQP